MLLTYLNSIEIILRENRLTVLNHVREHENLL
jgi:hypothetical protein